MAPDHPKSLSARLTLETWRQIETILHAALERDPGERQHFIKEACGDNHELRREVESLLAGEYATQNCLDQPFGGSMASALAPLAAQSLLGNYRILEPIGAGGMGQVYRAQDQRLGRIVAIKTLTASRYTDPERRRRFLQEARAASALQHPNIVTLYELGTAVGQDFIVMEYIAGTPLDRLIPKNGFPFNQALAYAIQIADGVAAAHSASVIHRDLKPGNIMVTEAGQIKLLDFGLAKLAVPAEQTFATDTLTQAGMIVGTAAYMSPEQAEGKKVDARTDIFSFGAVLYEMLTGRRVFQRESVSATLAAIVHEDATPICEFLPAAPNELERILRSCLRKDPARRSQNMADVKLALEDLKEDSDSGRLPVPAPARARSSRSSVLAGGILIALVVGGGILWQMTRSPAAEPPPTLTRLTYDSGLSTEPALSPDGKLLAYASDRAGEGNLDIWVKQIGGGDPIRITRDPADEHEPAFSPDGTTIAFRSEGKEPGVYVVSALGGNPRKLAANGKRPQFSPAGDLIAYWVGGPIAPVGAHFGKAGYLLLYTVPVTGGVPRQVQPDFAAALYPTWSPDGKHILFLGKPDDASAAEESVDWFVTPAEGGAAIRTGITDAARRAGLTGLSFVYPWMLISPAWAPNGDAVVFSARSGDTTNLWQFGISTDSWQVTGPPKRLTYGTSSEEGPTLAYGKGGTLRAAFGAVNLNSDIWFLEMDWASGRLRNTPKMLIGGPTYDTSPAISADYKKMVFISNRNGSQQVWIRDLQSAKDRVLTVSRSQKVTARISPDGSTVSFSSLENNKWNIYVVPSTGGAVELICPDCGHATGWSTDGRFAFFNTVRGRAGVIEILSRTNTKLWVHPRDFVSEGQFSPDGRWIAFWASDKVYIARLSTNAPLPPTEWGDPVARDVHLIGWDPSGNWLLTNTYPDIVWWSHRLDPATKRSVGPPILVHKASEIGTISNSENVPLPRPTPGSIAFSREYRTGEIWMAEFLP